VKDCARAKYI
jgi:CRP/FNR family cyclic AMP-dependent transcriptional regulator